MFDPESLMFQTDWKPLEDWFRRRAEEAVARGEISNIYQHKEVINVSPAIDPKDAGMAMELGYRAGLSIANLLDEFGGNMKPKKAFITLTLARMDVLTVVDALKGYAQLQVRDGHPNDAAVTRHMADTISEALK